MPSVFSAVSAAGYKVSNGTEDAEVTLLAGVGRSLTKRNERFAVISKLPDRKSRMWLNLIASQNVKVVVLSDGSPVDTTLSPAIPVIELPASMVSIMDALDMPITDNPIMRSVIDLSLDLDMSAAGSAPAPVAQPAAPTVAPAAPVEPAFTPAPVPAAQPVPARVVPQPVTSAPAAVPDAPVAPRPVPADLLPPVPAPAPAPVVEPAFTNPPPVAPRPSLSDTGPVTARPYSVFDTGSFPAVRSEDDLTDTGPIPVTRTPFVDATEPDPILSEVDEFTEADPDPIVPAEPEVEEFDIAPTPVAPVVQTAPEPEVEEFDAVPAPVTRLAFDAEFDEFEEVDDEAPLPPVSAPVDEFADFEDDEPAAAPVDEFADFESAAAEPEATPAASIWDGILDEDEVVTDSEPYVAPPVSLPPPVIPAAVVPPVVAAPPPQFVKPVVADQSWPVPVPETSRPQSADDGWPVPVPSTMQTPFAAEFPNPETGQVSPPVHPSATVPVGEPNRAEFGLGARRPSNPRLNGSAPIVPVFASKGGVGKSSIAAMLAERAAKVGGLNVALIDGNRGQADLGKYLRLNSKNLTTVLDAALRGDPKFAISPPGVVNAARPNDLDDLHIYLVVGASEQQADPNIVTSKVYRDVFELCRAKCDLVIVDTQIVEDHDLSGIFDQALIPAMQSEGGYGIGVTDASRPGLTNLYHRLVEFRGLNIPENRMFSLVNRTHDEFEGAAAEEARNRLSQHSRYVGHIPADHTGVLHAMNQGALPHSVPAVAKVLDEILYKITAMPQFDPAHHQLAPRKGLLARLRGGN